MIVTMIALLTTDTEGKKVEVMILLVVAAVAIVVMKVEETVIVVLIGIVTSIEVGEVVGALALVAEEVVVVSAEEEKGKLLWAKFPKLQMQFRDIH